MLNYIIVFIKKVINYFWNNDVEIPIPIDDSITCSFTYDDNTDSSFYAKLFPDMQLNCYRCLIEFIKPYTVEGAAILDKLLPKHGPVLAIDLGYMLAGLVLQFDLKTLILPDLEDRILLKTKFLHFNLRSLVNVRITIIKLLSFEGYVGAGGIDAMQMISVAASVGASTIAANQASNYFRTSLENMVEVKTILTEEEEEWICKDRKHVNFSKSSNQAHDHPYLAACREIIRADFNKFVNLKATVLRTLMLGTSAREYSEYNSNTNVSFQFSNSENKDVIRTVLDALNRVKTLKSKKLKRSKTSRRKHDLGQNLVDLATVMTELKETRNLPERLLIIDDILKLSDSDKDNKFEMLIFQDVGYNFDERYWVSLFKKTNAIMAIGYMCLPWELLEDAIVAPPGYTYMQRGSYSYMGYHGYSNGYVHPTNTWSVLMRNVVLYYSGTYIGVEFMSRVGPMTLICLYRANQTERIARHLELPSYLKTIRILDISASFDSKYSRIMLEDLKYFAVKEQEFNDSVNYGLDIAKESLNYANIMVYVRRRCSGVGLLSKGLTGTWVIGTSMVPQFAMVVYLYVSYLSQTFIKFQDTYRSSNISPFSLLLRRKLGGTLKTVKSIYEYFYRNDLFHLLTKDVRSDVWQERVIKIYSNHERLYVSTNPGPLAGDSGEFTNVETEDDPDMTSCYFCTELREVSGAQLFTCQRHLDEDTFHNFSLTQAELNEFRTKLADTDNDHPGLKRVKEDALKHTPLASFDNKIRVKYICGPPGTGKSYIIRAMATSNDLILGPFSRLADDYKDFSHPLTGKRTSLKYKTQHSGIEARNHMRIFVDEFTAFPYECLSIIVNNSAASLVILVGDHNQTGLIGGVEGISILSKIDLKLIRAHELIKNFRNPMDSVYVLNTLYGYKMIPTNTNKGFIIDTTDHYEKYKQHTPLFFKYITATKFGISTSTSDKVSVRANQGATFDYVKLVITAADKDIFNMTSMAIVALSRHRVECVLLFEQQQSDVACFRANIISAMTARIISLPNNISPIFSRNEILDRTDSEYLTMPPLEHVCMDDDDNSIVLDANNDDTHINNNSKELYDDSDDDDVDNNNNRIYFTLRLFGYRINANAIVPEITGFASIDRIIVYPIYAPIIYYYLFMLMILKFVILSIIHSKNKLLNFINNYRRRRDDDDDDQPNNFNHNHHHNDDNNISNNHPGNNVNGNDGSIDKPNGNNNNGVDSQTASDIDTSSLFPYHDTMPKPTIIPDKTPIISSTPKRSFNIDRADTIDINDKVNLQRSLNIIDYPSKAILDLSIGNRFNINKFDRARSISMLSSNIPESVYTTPSDNNCLLNCISKLTIAPIDKVWLSLVAAIGINWAKQLYNLPLSVEELRHFCFLNECRIDVVSLNTTYACGIIGPFLGIIHHITHPRGHFLVTNTVSARKLNLRITSNPSNIRYSTRPFTTYWSDLLILAYNQRKYLPMDKLLITIRSYECDLINDKYLRHKMEVELGVIKQIKLLTMSDLINLLSGLPADDNRILKIIKIVLHYRTQKFFNKLDTTIINLELPFGNILGGSEVQVNSLSSISTLTIKDCPPMPLTDTNVNFTEMARLFADPIYITTLLIEARELSKYEHVSIEQSPFDVFRLLKEEFSIEREHDLIITNQESLEYLDDDFDNGTFNMSIIDNLNPRLHPKRSTYQAWCLVNNPPGVTYFNDNLSQAMHCLQTRYLTKSFLTTFSYASEDKAREIADLFFNEHMKYDYSIFNEQDITNTIYESEHSMKIKHYDKQEKFETHGIDTIVRFAMKDVFKPIKTKVDLFKAGQGISAWAKDMQIIFQTGFRLINKHFINSLKDHVVYDNGIDEFTLMTRVNNLFKLLPSTSINGIIDATACDSGQNKFTQAIERRILEHLGVSDKFIIWYYQQRENYILKGYGVTANIKDIKTSGEPATLLNNTILMACLMNYLLRGEGPSVIVVKGDDGLKRQANLTCSNNNLNSLQKFLKMQFKVDINIPMTFCGYFLKDEYLVPDIVRKVFKILGHRFRDYEHFKEYQQSLRDWILIVNKLGILPICEIVAKVYKLEINYCYSLFHCIVSMSHINERQFKINFNLRTIDYKENFLTTKPWDEKVPWYTGDN